MHTAQPHQEQIRNHKAQARDSADDEVLVRVENVSKIFCRDLKKSLLYGLKDSARDLMSWGKRGTVPGASCLVPGEECLNGHPDHPGSTKHQAPSTRNQARALRAGEFLAVDNVSLELRRGECLGLIGKNGAGKTTLLKMLNGLIKPDAGRIEMRGRVGALIALGAGFNPILSGRENIYVNGSILGLSKAEIDAKIDEIIDFAEISEFIDSPVQSYSSGMQVRLGFAVATTMEPDILILDEVLAVGDRTFRTKCMARISKVLERAAVIMVSHDDAQIRQKCDRVIWLKNGSMQFDGSTSNGLKLYTSEYRVERKNVNVVEYPIQHVKVAIENQSFTQKRQISFSIEVESAEQTTVDYVVTTIESDTGIPAAQSMPTGLPLHLPKGRSTLKLLYGELDLAPGNYQLSVLFSKNNGKQMLFNSLYNANFSTSGSSYLWAAYQPKCLLKEI